MGDACELLVAGELTLAGVPAMRAPDFWPGYDIVAQPPGRPLQRISVKSRTFKKGAAFVSYSSRDPFDWLAIVIISLDSNARSMFLIPREIADRKARTYKTEGTANLREYRIDEVEALFAEFRNNFTLNGAGHAAGQKWQLGDMF